MENNTREQYQRYVDAPGVKERDTIETRDTSAVFPAFFFKSPIPCEQK